MKGDDDGDGGERRYENTVEIDFRSHAAFSFSGWRLALPVAAGNAEAASG